MSFANLPGDVYDDIGRAVRAVARGYFETYQATQHAAAAPAPELLARQAIGVFDSGSGGMVTAAWLLKDAGLDGISVVFFGDTANLPYRDSAAGRQAQR